MRMQNMLASEIINSLKNVIQQSSQRMLFSIDLFNTIENGADSNGNGSNSIMQTSKRLSCVR